MVIVLTAGIGIGGLQLRPALAYYRQRDLEWMSNATSAERRDNAHRALALWLGDPHDAFVTLQGDGDHSSIPHLQRALEGQPAEGTFACTWQHGHAALASAQRLHGH